MDETGADLIFLISQPRSGSTLLQNVLRGHPRIDTLPEAWFMLHLLYGMRPEGLAAEYDASTAQRALTEYLSTVGGGRQLFIKSVRAAALSLYGGALQRSEKDLFLDKTPRYYLIAEELRETFPNARFVFLVRNPLAVLASMLHALRGDWTALRRIDRMHDLITAPRNIARATMTLDERAALLRYEDFVGDVEGSLSQLFTQLDIDYVEGLGRYRAFVSALGDTKSVTRHTSPVTDYVDRWRTELRSPGRRALAMSYLDALGAELLERLGYSYRDLAHQLEAGQLPRRDGRHWRMLVTSDEELTWWDRMTLSFVHSRYQRATSRTLLRMAYMAIFGHARPRRMRRDHIDRRPV